MKNKLLPFGAVELEERLAFTIARLIEEFNATDADIYRFTSDAIRETREELASG